MEMASPTRDSNPVRNLERSRECRRKRKKMKSRDEIQNEIHNNNNNNQLSWKSEKTEQIYSSKLIESLKRLRVSSPSVPRRGRAVREAADRALAVAAKGGTRWSRAILKNRVKLKFMKRRKPKVHEEQDRKWRIEILRLKRGNNLGAVHRKVRVLGRLVPGCNREAFPVILQEAVDYIAALQMQVRALTTLTDFNAPSTSSSPASSS